MTQRPITNRRADETIAWRDGEAVTAGRLLAEAQLLSERLPPATHAVNRCHSRYHFMRAFVAILMAGQTNVLPPDRLATTTRRLLDDYPDAYVLTDEPDTSHERIVDAVLRDQPHQGMATAPIVEAHHLAALASTSGSSGQPKPIDKPWYTLHDSTLINAAAMGLDTAPIRNLVATVPAQHMYGLETSVLNPLLAPVATSDALPLFPGDIRAALEAVPAPRVLITTPAHLRSLADPELQLPPLETVWSATAPLDPSLARDIEYLHETRVHEIYGCSEVGSLAKRRTTAGTNWRLFPGFSLRDKDDGAMTVEAPHLPQARTLPDRIMRHSKRVFRILGRADDIINVAGKRASLSQLSESLRALDGVEDGVIFERPEHDRQTTTRLVAMVVAPNRDPASVRQALRVQVDDPFLPRPIHHVRALPRSETGKLPRSVLLEQLAQIEGNTPDEQHQA